MGPEFAAAFQVLSAVGSVVSAAGALKSGASARAAGDYNAKVQENQAIAARQQAEIEAARHEKRIALLSSGQRSAYAGAGVTSEGSPILVMADTAAEGEYDAQLIRYGGEVKAVQHYAQAALDRQQGRAAQVGGYFTAGGQLLKGAGGLKGIGTGDKTKKTIIGDFSSDTEYA